MKRNLILGLLLLLASIQAAFAQDTPITVTETPRPERIGVVFVDGNGVLAPQVQANWEAPTLAALNGKSMENVRFVSGSSVMDGEKARTLGTSQREALLSLPYLLASSRHASTLVGARWLLIVRVKEGSKPLLRSHLVDVRRNERQSLSDATGKNQDEALAALKESVASVVARSAQEGAPVLGNVQSHLYHVATANHLKPEDTIQIATEREARDNGYQPCTICYPRENRIVTGDATEVSLGRQIAAQIEYTYRVSRDETMKERVRRVGNQIVDRNHLDTFNYTFGLLDTDEMNAFAAGAGHVFITRGLVRVLESDDELATVLAHEIAHVENHHVVRQYRQAQTMQIIGILTTIATGTNLGGALSNFFGSIIGRGHSRGFELEADEDGLLYAYAAGYEPGEFLHTLRKLQQVGKQMGKGSGPNWLRTHPTEEKRLQAAELKLTQLKGFDQQYTALEASDPGLYNELRSRTILLVEQSGPVTSFLSAYKSLGFIPAVSPSTTNAPTTSITVPDDGSEPHHRD